MKEENENIKDEESVNNTQNETNENVTDADNKAEETTDKNEEDGVKDGTEEKETDPLEAALNEIAQLKDKYLRSVAEFDNYRKRTLKEKAELILNGSEKAVQAILPIIDDMERALANSEKTEDAEVLKEGMKLIYQKPTK